MKKIIFIALALLAWSSSSYAAGWADTYTEDSSVAGTEKIFVENPTATGNNWMSLSTVKAYAMYWPTGAAGTIPVNGSSSWGTSYSLTTLAAALDGEAWTFTGAVDMSTASSVSMGPICFEGTTVDANDTCFSVTDPNAGRTIALGNFDMEIPAATAVDSSGNILIAGIADSTTEALGLGTIELGHASDTTIARSGAGAITVEGVGVALTTSPVFSTSLALPQGSAPTVDAAGEIAVDTTSDQLKYYGGAERVLTYKKQIDFAVKTPVDADDFFLFKAQTAITITDIHVITIGGTSISVDIQECGSDGTSCATVDAAITADTDGAEDDGTLSNGAIDAGDWVKVVLGAPSGTVNYLTGSIYYVETAN